MKFKPNEGDLTDPDKTTGFVEIKDLGDAQQVEVDIVKLKHLIRTITSLEGLGYKKIVITVENDNPIVFGGHKIGIALAPII